MHRPTLAAATALLLALAGCSTGPDVGSLLASRAAEPSSSGVQPPGASASESEAPSPSITESGTLTGIWDGTWVIDGYGNAGGFTMELVQTGNSFSGTVAITNTDCSNGPVDGTVDGTTITFGWLLTPQPVQFTGEVSGSSMSGTWSSIACSNANLSLTGTWEATRQ